MDRSENGPVQAETAPRYVCDPDKAQECPKTFCLYNPEAKIPFCGHTLRIDRARRDAGGNPILAEESD